jgi:site-specific DNA-methyltransferase (adenine-specific)/modification methylase
VKPDDASDCELIWTSSPKPTRIFRHLWKGLVREGEENISVQPKLHPNQKPVALMEWLLGYLEIPVGAIVLDPFMGSGSTGLACVRTGRRFIGIEVDPAYCEVARRRLDRPFVPVRPYQKHADFPLFSGVSD